MGREPRSTAGPGFPAGLLRLPSAGPTTKIRSGPGKKGVGQPQGEGCVCRGGLLGALTHQEKVICQASDPSHFPRKWAELLPLTMWSGRSGSHLANKVMDSKGQPLLPWCTFSAAQAAGLGPDQAGFQGPVSGGSLHDGSGELGCVLPCFLTSGCAEVWDEWPAGGRRRGWPRGGSAVTLIKGALHGLSL